jgi:hypothetical protein
LPTGWRESLDTSHEKHLLLGLTVAVVSFKNHAKISGDGQG